MKTTLEAQHEVITDLILEKKTEVINRKRECFKLHREIKDLSRQLDAIRGVLKANGGWIPGETLAESAARILKERVSRRAELEMWRGGNILHETHRDELQKVEQERDEARELAGAYKEYAQLLGDEVNSMATVAHFHGWKSSRVEQGKVLREKIKQMEEAK